MRTRGLATLAGLSGLLGVLFATAPGCFHGCKPCQEGPDGVPHELRLISLPPYIIEPPDILLISAPRVVPKPPYRLTPLDIVYINVPNAPANNPLSGQVGVDPEGTINLGVYGVVHVAGMTIAEAQKAVTDHLATRFKTPQVNLSLQQTHALQQIQGDHLVRPDGTVGFGTYGSVYVSGMTLDQARFAIEQHLGQFLLEPSISVDVYSFNSKFYYVIADGAGYGQQVIRFPITGKETVLDAISQIYGLPLVSSKYKIWVARPLGAEGCGGEQILPVDWNAIAMRGCPQTNYQILPNDRVFIQSQALIRTNNVITKILAPIERLLGFTLLASSTVQGIQQIGVLARSQGSSGIVTPSGTIVPTTPSTSR